MTSDTPEAVESLAVLIELNSYAPRLWSQVSIRGKNECWPWQGTVTKPEFPYGVIASPAGHTAHRLAWALANGRVPAPGSVIRHKCDNPRCCNPAHLLEGTPRDNVQDMIERGRAFWSSPDECRNGHPWSVENTVIRSTGKRYCKDCLREQNKRRGKRSEIRACYECGAAMADVNMARHFRVFHGRRITIDEVRAECELSDHRDRASRTATPEPTKEDRHE